jgi:outer membrane lipoprotein-sorting protein
MKNIILLFLLTQIAFAKSFLPASFTSKYEESTMSVTGKEKKTFGNLDYQYPTRLRIEIAEPNPSTLVINPQKTWIYQPPFLPKEKGTVTIQKTSNLPLVKIFDSLKNGVESSKLFTHEYKGKDLILKFNKGSNKDLKLAILTSKDEAKKVTSLKEFEKMTVEYTDGKKVSWKFLDLKENASFPADHFEFKIPANTKTVSP